MANRTPRSPRSPRRPGSLTPSIHAYFNSKAGLLYALVSETNARQDKRVAEVIGQPGTLRERLRRIVTVWAEHDLSDPALAAEMQAHPGSGRARPKRIASSTGAWVPTRARRPGRSDRSWRAAAGRGQGRPDRCATRHLHPRSAPGGVQGRDAGRVRRADAAANGAGSARRGRSEVATALL